MPTLVFWVFLLLGDAVGGNHPAKELQTNLDLFTSETNLDFLLKPAYIAVDE